MKKTLIVVMIILLLAACTPHLPGKIVAKYYTPYSSWVQFIPMTVGKTTTLVPVTHVTPESWNFRIEPPDGDKYTARVSPDVWEQYEVGDWYEEEEHD